MRGGIKGHRGSQKTVSLPINLFPQYSTKRRGAEIPSWVPS